VEALKIQSGWVILWIEGNDVMLEETMSTKNGGHRKFQHWYPTLFFVWKARFWFRDRENLVGNSHSSEYQRQPFFRYVNKDRILFADLLGLLDNLDIGRRARHDRCLIVRKGDPRIWLGVSQNLKS